jgi:hypothetical protein
MAGVAIGAGDESERAGVKKTAAAAGVVMMVVVVRTGAEDARK